MPRTLREREDNAIYKISNVINEKQKLMADEKAKELFLKVVYEAKIKKKFDFKLINISVMDSCFKFIIKTRYKQDISILMHWIQCVFAMRYNRKTGRCGRLWMDRFHSVIIRTKDQMRKIFKCISESPVRYGLCRKASEYKYGYSKLLKHFLIKYVLENSAIYL